MKRITPIVLFGLTAMMFYFAIVGSHGYLHLLRTQRETTSLQRKSSSLDKEMRELRRKIEGIERDPLALERQSREEVGLAKPDETVYIFPSRKTD